MSLEREIEEDIVGYLDENLQSVYFENDKKPTIMKIPFFLKKEDDLGKDIDVMLHEEVYTTEQILLETARETLAEPPKYDNKKAERLKNLSKLGFKNVGEVEEYERYAREMEIQKSLKETVEYYRQHYPLNNFITETAVNAVCQKYGLLLAEVGDYISQIPEKKQDEIINFKVIRKDACSVKENTWGNIIWESELGSYDHQKNMRKLNPGWDKNKIPGRNLMILAPLEKLNTKDKKIVDYRLISKDPIVLQPVEGKGKHNSVTRGFLIVSSWGLEAGDETVVNPITN